LSDFVGPLADLSLTIDFTEISEYYYIYHHVSVVVEISSTFETLVYYSNELLLSILKPVLIIDPIRIEKQFVSCRFLNIMIAFHCH